MKRLKYFALAAAVASAACAESLEAQVQDSVVFNVLSPPTAISITTPERVYRGDVHVLDFVPLDEAGNRTDATVTFSLQPLGRAVVTGQTDSTVTIRFDQPGRVTLIAMVERAELLVMGFEFQNPTIDERGEVPIRQEAGTFRWADFDAEGHLEVGARVHVCAAILSGERVTATSSPTCYDHLRTLVSVVPPRPDVPVVDVNFGISSSDPEAVWEWLPNERNVFRVTAVGPTTRRGQ